MQDLILITFSKSEFKEIIKECVIECLNAHKQPEIYDDNARPMSINEASLFLNLAVQTIYGFTSKNLIPFSKRGKRLYFTKSELIKWVNEGRTKTIAEIEREAENYLKSKKAGLNR